MCLSSFESPCTACNQALVNQHTVHSDMPDRTELPRTLHVCYRLSPFVIFAYFFAQFFRSIFVFPLRCTRERGFWICGRGQVCLDGKPGNPDVNGVNLGFGVTKPRTMFATVNGTQRRWPRSVERIATPSADGVKIDLKETIRMIVTYCNSLTVATELPDSPGLN